MATRGLWLTLMLTVCVASDSSAECKDEPNPARRGEMTLLHSSELFLPKFRAEVYDNAWKAWGLTRKPKDFDRLFRERYGLHPASYDNDGLPMGLRYVDVDDREQRKTFGKRALTLDCLICHSTSFDGRGIVGGSNSSLDYTALVHELASLDERRFAPEAEYPLNVTRGTAEIGALVVAAFAVRNPDLGTRKLDDPRNLYPDGVEQPPIVPEEPPAWWNLRPKKERMYVTGMASSESRRSLMIFLLDYRADRRRLEKLEPGFDDVRAYIRDLEPPAYPFTIDESLADAGRTVFADHCAHCHGTYGEKPEYPNRLVSLEDIGTDPARATVAYPEKYIAFYNGTWFGKDTGEWTEAYTNDGPGYVAPPLHGVWATAPYLHNGSVPTIEHLLDSKTRPKRFTRSFRTDSNDYDPNRVGWRTTEVAPETKVDRATLRGRRLYDTTLPGHSNQGHTFGDDLADEERKAVIEYLKTL